MFEESANSGPAGGEDSKGVKLRIRMQARLGEILAQKAVAQSASAAVGGRPPLVPSRSPKGQVGLPDNSFCLCDGANNLPFLCETSRCCDADAGSCGGSRRLPL